MSDAEAAAGARAGSAVDTGTAGTVGSGTVRTAGTVGSGAVGTVGSGTARTVELNLLGSLVVAVVAGVALAVTARADAVALLIAVAAAQALFAVAWALGSGMPGHRGAIVIATLAGAGADVAVSVWPHGRLGILLPVLGLAVPVMFVHQLTRGTSRREIVSSLSAVALLVLAEVALPALLQLRHEFTDADLGGRAVSAVTAATAGALVVGYLVDIVFPGPRFDPAVPRGLLALIASTGLGGSVGYLLLGADAEFTGGRAAFVGAALGALAGLLAVAAAFVLYTTPRPSSRLRRALRPVFAALLPLCALAPAAFLLCLAVRS